MKLSDGLLPGNNYDIRLYKMYFHDYTFVSCSMNFQPTIPYYECLFRKNEKTLRIPCFCRFKYRKPSIQTKILKQVLSSIIDDTIVLNQISEGYF